MAIALAVLVIVTGVAAAVVASGAHQLGSNGYGEIAVVVVFAVVGLLVTIGRRQNPTGWLLLGGALFFALTSLASSYSILDYQMRDGRLALGWVSLLVAESWAPAIICVSVALLLFPDGRPATRVTGWVLWMVLAVGAVWQGGAFGIAISAIVEHRIHIDPGGDLYAIDHPVGNWAWWYDVAQPAFFTTLGVAWIVWLLQQVPLYRRAGGDRRLQLKWLYAGATICVIGGALSLSLSSSSSETLRVLAGVGTGLVVALPLSIGIAVTKFHLYDVDRVVSRTISYGLVTALVIGCYVGVIALLTKLIGHSSPIAVAGSTLVAAAAFNPLRRHVQRGVDRRFNRARYDAEATVAAFAARLRESVGIDSVRQELAGVVQRAVEPELVAVWVRPVTRS
jgi:hypothetical protein